MRGSDMSYMNSSASRQRTSYFRTERMFFLSLSDCKENGWYFWIRGGKPMGPYVDRMEAEIFLEEMKDEFQINGDTGGR